MKQLNIREARKELSRLDSLLESEGEIMITKRGQAVARVVQLRRKMPIPSHRALREKSHLLKKGSEKLVREDRDAR